ncbi:MAG: hypothetical protein RBJ76_08125 [Stenomitos frigidus ULC029]
MAEFRFASSPPLSSPSNLVSSTLRKTAYYGDDAASAQFSALPHWRVAEPILTSTGWLNIPPDDYPLTVATESVSRSSIANLVVRPTQPVDRQFAALSQPKAISSSTEIVSNYAQSGERQFKQLFQILDNAPSISSSVERFDTGAQTQGVDRPIPSLIQLDTGTSAKLLNVDGSNQSVDRRTQILKTFQEGNGSVRMGLTDQVLDSKDIPTKPMPPEKALLKPSMIAPPSPPILGRAKTQSPPALRDSESHAEARATAFIPRFSNATEERLMTWSPLIQADAISPAPLSNVPVSQPNDRQFQLSDQGLNNPAISLEALATADAYSKFRVRRAQPLLQKTSQAQSNLSTALSNSVPRDYPDRLSQVLPSVHINSAHMDSAVVLNRSMIRPLSPATKGETSTQSPLGLQDLKPLSQARKGESAEARLAASIPQSGNVTSVASRSFVTSAPTTSPAVAELQVLDTAETDFDGSLPGQITIRPDQQINPRSLSIPSSDPTIPALATEQASFANTVNTKLKPLDVARLTIPQSLLELEEASAAFAALSTLQPGTSVLGLPPSPLLPLPASESSNSAPLPPLPLPPDRSPIESKQPPTFPEPMPVIAPPRPALSLNDYLNRRRRGQR